MKENESQNVWSYPWPSITEKKKNISIRKSTKISKNNEKVVLSNSSYDKVPWFSWEEWKIVKASIFGNSAEDWKSAYHQILVWKARVPKLAVGIESTLPVLHAQIAQVDSSMEASFKNSIINMAILRFVSIVTKGLERHYLVDTPLHGLASSINLPQYLVDLRNEIIHSDSLFGMSQTTKSAIETCLLWIKIHYWEVEEKRVQSILDSENDKIYSCTEEANMDSSSEEQEVCTENIIDKSDMKFRLLNSSLKDLTSFLLPKNAKVLRLEIVGKKLTTVGVYLKKYYEDSPETSINILVRELFYSPIVQQGCYIRKTKNFKKCACRSPVPLIVIQKYSKIITIVDRLQAINLFMKSMVDIGTESPGLCCHWFKIIKNTFAVKGKNCTLHRFKVKDLKRVNENIKWNRIIFQLLNITEQWCSHLAVELSDLGQNALDPPSKELLKEVTSIYLNGCKKKSGPKSRTMNGSDNTTQPVKLKFGKISTLEDLMKEAHKSSPATLSYVEELSSLVQTNKKGKTNKNCIIGTPLGLLPNQLVDPYFYNQLKLNELNNPH